MVRITRGCKNCMICHLEYTVSFMINSEFSGFLEEISKRILRFYHPRIAQTPGGHGASISSHLNQKTLLTQGFRYPQSSAFCQLCFFQRSRRDLNPRSLPWQGSVLSQATPRDLATQKNRRLGVSSLLRSLRNSPEQSLPYAENAGQVSVQFLDFCIAFDSNPLFWR